MLSLPILPSESGLSKLVCCYTNSDSHCEHILGDKVSDVNSDITSYVILHYTGVGGVAVVDKNRGVWYKWCGVDERCLVKVQSRQGVC